MSGEKGVRKGPPGFSRADVFDSDSHHRTKGAAFAFVGLIGVFLTRFFLEFIKTEQEAFEVGWPLYMGQWLSIPFVVLGVWMIVRACRRPADDRRLGKTA